MDRRRILNEIIIAFSVFLVGLYGLLESLKMPMPKGDPHGSPGLTPAFLSLVLMALSSGLIAYLFIKRREIGASRREADESKKEERELERVRLKRLLTFMALTIAYVALLGRIPYVLATFLYLISSYICFRSAKLHIALGISILVSLGLAYSFGKLFAVRLP
ncbi:MAG: tripartite tricarboxylate transporter TctB family protein [Synergistetes bacterium]|nr:tripartite tricarboxylate transporter TctB family protein [Synergistota bacterium]